MERLYDRQILSRIVVDHAAEMAQAFSLCLGLPREQAREVGLAARFQDIGMAKLPESFYIRGQSRTEEETLRIRTHVTQGYTMARQFEELYKVADVILHSHENWDGTGYPNQLVAEQIPLEARIIHIVGDYTYWTMPTISGGNYPRELAGSIYDPELTEDFFRCLDSYRPSEPEPDAGAQD